MDVNRSVHEGASFKQPGGIIYFWAARFRAVFTVFLRLYAPPQLGLLVLGRLPDLAQGVAAVGRQVRVAPWYTLYVS
jgi:hypothetical protein